MNRRTKRIKRMRLNSFFFLLQINLFEVELFVELFRLGSKQRKKISCNQHIHTTEFIRKYNLSCKSVLIYESYRPAYQIKRQITLNGFNQMNVKGNNNKKKNDEQKSTSKKKVTRLGKNFNKKWKLFGFVSFCVYTSREMTRLLVVSRMKTHIPQNSGVLLFAFLLCTLNGITLSHIISEYFLLLGYEQILWKKERDNSFYILFGHKNNMNLQIDETQKKTFSFLR